MKTLLLIPSVLKEATEPLVKADRHPLMDYFALANTLEQNSGDSADLLDYGAVERMRDPLVRLTRQVAGADAALALAGFLRRKDYDAIFTNGENVGIPLALLLKSATRRPIHVTIGHRPSTGKKRIFFRNLGVHQQIDRIFVYASTQYTVARDTLGIPDEKLSLIAFHADTRFYHPQPTVAVNENQICAAGLEWRDYPTLIEAVRDMPDLTVKLAAASPWSKHTDETANRTLPTNVSAQRYEYEDLRTLYAQSSFVVVPLYENDFQAGVTTLLEAMAMGKAVIVTSTTGQTDVITHEENGLTVAPGDVAGWKEAINRLRSDAPLRQQLGANARKWIEENATLDQWTQRIASALHRGKATDILVRSRENGKTISSE